MDVRRATIELERATVLVDPELDDSVVEGLRKITGRPVRRHAGTASHNLDDHVDDDVPVIHVGPALPDFLRSPRLLWMHSTNAGVDALLRSGPWPSGALLTRTVGRMGERIAQYVLAWVLAECQNIPAFLDQQQRAEWRRLPSELVAGRTALVYGAGRIGTRVGSLLRACGVRTVGVARTARAAADDGFDETVDVDTADALLGQARWVVSTLPLTPETQDFFGPERFAAMRGVTFINTGRGTSVDPAALADALESGRVSTAVLDVLREEPAASDDPVWSLPRTFITSHSAGITAPDDVHTDFAACWNALIEGHTPELAVTPDRGY